MTRNRDRLDPDKQARYDELTKLVDTNLELIIKDRDLYQKNLGLDNSVASSYTVGSNIYSIEGE